MVRTEFAAIFWPALWSISTLLVLSYHSFRVKAASNSGKVTKIADSEEDNEDWFVFDDDEVSPCKTEDVLKLKGGGDWHMSYLNFYRAKK